MKARGYIYLITNNVNKKCYVGKTFRTIDERFKEHLSESKKERSASRALYRAMNKYGQENFLINLLEEVECDLDGELLSEREMYWINKYDTYKNGYNSTIGGDGTPYLDRELIIKTYQKLQSLVETANKCNCSKDAVHDILKASNINILGKEDVMRNKVGRKIIQKTKEGKKINIFDSIRLAAVELGDLKKRRHITECAEGKRKSAYGYVWEYV